MPRKPKWTRQAFIAELPKRCLACQGPISLKERDLTRTDNGHTTTVAMVMTAACTRHVSCGAIYAQQPPRGERFGTGYMYGRSEVRFVSTLPYHISLGGEAAKVLAKDDFAKPGRFYSESVIDVVR